MIVNSSELGAGTRGSSLGTQAMLVAAHNKGSGFFGDHEILRIEHENSRLNRPSEFQNARYIDGITEIYKKISSATEETLKAGQFPLVLAGDHSSAGGTISGIKKAYPDKRLGVIWIDAHADLHSPYTTPSGNMHGMPLAKAIAVDNLEFQINEPTEETVRMWNDLKEMGGAPNVKPEDIVFMAVRSTEPAEDHIIKQHNIKNYTVGQLRETRLDIVVNTVENRLEDCDIVYISFDVDSMDPYLVSHGTGTPVENGLTPEEAEILVRKFAVWSKCVALEFVEINPCLDEKLNRMAEVSFEILEKVCTDLENIDR